MFKKHLNLCLGVACMSLAITACKTPALVVKTQNQAVPASYNNSQDSTNSANTSWRGYFADPYLAALIDTALYNNQELNVTLQEIQIANNEVFARSGAYRPFVGLGGGAGID
ncbi:MAG: TolC family protein, partial [Cytophagaceae bacterium]